MRVSVDQNACEGTGYCVRVLPSVFTFNSDHVIVVNQADVKASVTALLEEAERLCPTGAIQLEGDSSSI